LETENNNFLSQFFFDNFLKKVSVQGFLAKKKPNQPEKRHGKKNDLLTFLWA